MGVIFPLLFVAFIILSSFARTSAAKNKSNSDRRTASGAAQQSAVPEKGEQKDAWTCNICGQKGNTGKFCTFCGKARYVPKQKAPATATHSPLTARVAPTKIHTVEATALGGHTHVESSIAGNEDGCIRSDYHVVSESSMSGHYHAENSINGGADGCPASVSTIQGIQSAASSPSVLPLDMDAVRNAIIYSEILGKPKALRNNQ